jgi:hypothetical protein
MEEERSHIFVLSFEAVCHLRSDAYLVLASELETLGLFSDLHEEPYALLLGRRVCFDHFNEAVYFWGEGMDRGGEDSVELAKVCKLAGDICGKSVEKLSVFWEEREGISGR